MKPLFSILNMEEAKLRSRKRISKKRKSAWRKHSQVKEVDDYFKNKRIEDRLGNFANDEDVENLFTTEEEFTESAQKRVKTSKDVILKSHFPPSLDDHIKPIRNPAPNKAKVQVEPKKKVTCHIEIQVEEYAEDETIEEYKTNVFDMWGAPKPSSKSSKDVDVHGNMVCKVTRIKPPSHFGKKPNENPAIPIPLPGTSYHPSSKDHEELIKAAYEAEVAKITRETKITNATDKMFPARSEAPTEETWLKEMSHGLPIPGVNDGAGDDDDNDDNEGEEKETSAFKISHNPPVRREDKKTEKERKKMKELKMEEKKLKVEREKKMWEAEKFKINSSKKRILQEEMKRAIKRSWKRFDTEERKNLPKKLGKIRFQEPDLDLKLSDEMTDSLRSLKPEGHILKDLVSSIQRRSMAPATGKGEPKKRQKRYKPKVFEKNGHKNITL